jgi:hypothetical protein
MGAITQKKVKTFFEKNEIEVPDVGKEINVKRDI